VRSGLPLGLRGTVFSRVQLFFAERAAFCGAHTCTRTLAPTRADLRQLFSFRGHDCPFEFHGIFFWRTHVQLFTQRLPPWAKGCLFWHLFAHANFSMNFYFWRAPVQLFARPVQLFAHPVQLFARTSNYSRAHLPMGESHQMF